MTDKNPNDMTTYEKDYVSHVIQHYQALTQELIEEGQLRGLHALINPTLMHILLDASAFYAVRRFPDSTRFAELAAQYFEACSDDLEDRPSHVSD